MVTYFVDLQKRALFQVAQVAVDLLPAHTVDEAIAAAARVLTGPTRTFDPSVWSRLKENADSLMRIASDRVDKVAATLRRQISEKRSDFSFGSGSLYSAHLAKEQLGYEPNTIA